MHREENLVYHNDWNKMSSCALWEVVSQTISKQSHPEVSSEKSLHIAKE